MSRCPYSDSGYDEIHFNIQIVSACSIVSADDIKSAKQLPFEHKQTQK